MNFSKYLLFIFFLLLGFYSHSSEKMNNDLDTVRQRYRELMEARDRYVKSLYEMMDPQEVSVLHEYWADERKKREEVQMKNKVERKKLLNTIISSVGGKEAVFVMIMIETYIYYENFLNKAYENYDGYDFSIHLYEDYKEINLLIQFLAKYFVDKDELKRVISKTFQEPRDAKSPLVLVSRLQYLEKQWGAFKMKYNLEKYKLMDPIFISSRSSSFSAGKDSA